MSTGEILAMNTADQRVEESNVENSTVLTEKKKVGQVIADNYSVRTSKQSQNTH
jgi:hypothetical protein